jgi:APA family basic amino acid/polyamine antiporter
VDTRVRGIDVVAGGVAAGFGAGLFAGPAPAASLAGGWLLAALALAAAAGLAIALSTTERPDGTVALPLRRLRFALATLGRLAAAVATAAAAGTYLTPDRPAFGALGVVVLATAAAVTGVPPVVVRVAAGVVVAVLVLVVVSCFAIAPVAPPVAVPDVPSDGSSVPGVLGAAGLLVVCFLGFSPVGPAPGGVPSGLDRPDGRWRLVVFGVVAVLCLAVVAAVLRQLGPARLALSPAPLRAALAAADASALEPLLLVGVAVGCGFATTGVLRGLRVPGIPRVRLVVAAGAATALGALLVPPVAALAAAAVLLLAGAGLAVAVRHRRRSG